MRTMKTSSRKTSAGRKGKPAPKMSTRRSVSGAVRGRAKTPARLSTRKSVTGRSRATPEIGGMTVREAGRKGGLIGGKKGGETVKRERGIQFFQEIGRKGGQRVRDLIAAGKRAIERPRRGRHA